MAAGCVGTRGAASRRPVHRRYDGGATNGMTGGATDAVDDEAAPAAAAACAGADAAAPPALAGCVRAPSPPPLAATSGPESGGALCFDGSTVGVGACTAATGVAAGAATGEAAWPAAGDGRAGPAHTEIDAGAGCGAGCAAGAGTAATAGAGGGARGRRRGGAGLDAGWTGALPPRTSICSHMAAGAEPAVIVDRGALAGRGAGRRSGGAMSVPRRPSPAACAARPLIRLYSLDKRLEPCAAMSAQVMVSWWSTSTSRGRHCSVGWRRGRESGRDRQRDAPQATAADTHRIVVGSWAGVTPHIQWRSKWVKGLPTCPAEVERADKLGWQQAPHAIW